MYTRLEATPLLTCCLFAAQTFLAIHLHASGSCWLDDCHSSGWTSLLHQHCPELRLEISFDPNTWASKGRVHGSQIHSFDWLLVIHCLSLIIHPVLCCDIINWLKEVRSVWGCVQGRTKLSMMSCKQASILSLLPHPGLGTWLPILIMFVANIQQQTNRHCINW